MPPRVVAKFGGTSVASLERWQTIAQVARDHLDAGRHPVVVCSAVAGISDQLVALVAATTMGGHEQLLDAIEARHHQLADELGVDAVCIADELASLRRLATGASLLGEAAPSVHARILAHGELLSTRLGAAWLEAQGLPVSWVDARTLLTSDGRGGPERAFLGAHVAPRADESLDARLPEGLVLTQGFIAHDPKGRTVLLGRGGSDTSAALLAGRLGVPCEIWTDVPGMFTADPRRVPAARLLRRLSYDEAQEIATMGAKVLHPRAIAPVRVAGVPLTIRCTQRPELEGTTIAQSASAGAQVKAISHRTGLVLVAMETLGMWQEVGFLAKAFQIFAEHGLSIDLVSTSETSVTVSLDPSANALDVALPACLEELSSSCRPRRIDACASVSLVGRGIRTILHRLAPVFELFEEQRVHLLSQAASDLNLTVVVDEEHAPKLVERLHATLFAHRGADQLLGPTWEQLFRPTTAEVDVDVTTPWWHEQRAGLLEVAAAGTPVYVTHRPTLMDRADALLALEHVDSVLYAIKANPHPDILAAFAERGLGFETVSPGEIARVREAHPDAPILFTPNFAPREEYEQAFLDDGVTVTLDNLHPLEAWPDVFEHRPIFVRLDPGKGRGHHQKVRTAGARSKFGVSLDQLPTLKAAADRVGARIVGLHAHAGSGVLDPLAWQDTAAFLASVAADLPDVVTLDLGGGLGIPPRPGAAGLDLRALDRGLGEVKAAHPRYRLQLEPGRFLVAEAGVLLARVTQTKRKSDVHYLGVDAGMHTLIRPALYGARHPLENLSHPDAPHGPPTTVVGPVCETGDVLARDRLFPAANEGDVLLLAFAGAYGAAMASDYNLRGRPRDVVWDPSP